MLLLYYLLTTNYIVASLTSTNCRQVAYPGTIVEALPHYNWLSCIWVLFSWKLYLSWSVESKQWRQGAGSSIQQNFVPFISGSLEKKLGQFLQPFLHPPPPPDLLWKCGWMGAIWSEGALLDNTLQVQWLLPEGKITIVIVAFCRYFSKSSLIVILLFFES